MAQYVVDTAFFLTNTLVSISTTAKTLRQFSKVSSYNVKQDQYEIMSINIRGSTKEAK